jgi:hypothetical protein
VSKLRRASTSVDTTPGTSFRISQPKATDSLSSSRPRSPPAAARAPSTSARYAGSCAAAATSDGFVVASSGACVLIFESSPESTTMRVPEATSADRREEGSDMILRTKMLLSNHGETDTRTAFFNSVL